MPLDYARDERTKWVIDLGRPAGYTLRLGMSGALSARRMAQLKAGERPGFLYRPVW